MKTKYTKIYWRCYIRTSEWRGENEDFSVLIRCVKGEDRLWRFRLGGIVSQDFSKGGFLTLKAAKTAALVVFQKGLA